MSEAYIVLLMLVSIPWVALLIIAAIFCTSDAIRLAKNPNAPTRKVPWSDCPQMPPVKPPRNP